MNDSFRYTQSSLVIANSSTRKPTTAVAQGGPKNRSVPTQTARENECSLGSCGLPLQMCCVCRPLGARLHSNNGRGRAQGYLGIRLGQREAVPTRRRTPMNSRKRTSNDQAHVDQTGCQEKSTQPRTHWERRANQRQTTGNGRWRGSRWGKYKVRGGESYLALFYLTFASTEGS